MQKEAKARIKINKLLEQAGWCLIDSASCKANVRFETNIKIDGMGDDFEKVTNGFVDYLLLDDKNKPLCVLEAKSEDKDPLTGKEQARKYADSQNARFVLLSNGNIHYFWDIKLGNPNRISSFPTSKSLGCYNEFNPSPEKLVNENVGRDYIVLTQNPNYMNDPRWLDESKRQTFIDDAKLRFLRQYQIDAVTQIQKSVKKGQNRFLFEMATGTGKTLVAGAIIKLYIKTGNARRVLFLVDRLELENQAEKDFKEYLMPDYKTVIFKENRDDWNKAEIVITTLQSLSYENKYLKIFAPTDFDLIISDEAHRSIYGTNRAIFEYFFCAKLGLTATPRDYLKNLNIAETDPREIERRALLSTYKTFGCESGTPTFRYSLIDGVKDDFLVNPVTIDCRTEITTKLLSDEGYSVLSSNDDGDEKEINYKQKDFERKLFSEKTNRELVKAFMENALRDPLTKEIGKTIVFCVNRRHASKITNILNEFAHAMFPGKYNSDFAVQVTSDIPDAQQMATNFSNNNLNGHTRFLEGYKTGKTRVCVTVGMMTTGYNCRDILNICLVRPIFSPTDFVQIKGRGTRKFTFKHIKRENGCETILTEEKSNFKLFDFFANCEFFEEKYDYDQILKLPKEPGGVTPPPPVPPTPPGDKTITLDIPDPIKSLNEVVIDENGMRIDREMYAGKFEEKVKETYEKVPEFKDAVDSGDYEKMEKIVKSNLFNKPEDYFNIERVRESYVSDRRLGLWEILDKIFGKILRFKTKDDIAEDEFARYLVEFGVPSDMYYEAREFFKSYLVDEDFRTVINQKRYNELTSNPMMMAMINKLNSARINDKPIVQIIPEYIKDNVILNKFL